MDNLHSGDIHTRFGFIASFLNPFIFIALRRGSDETGTN